MSQDNENRADNMFDDLGFDPFAPDDAGGVSNNSIDDVALPTTDDPFAGLDFPAQPAFEDTTVEAETLPAAPPSEVPLSAKEQKKAAKEKAKREKAAKKEKKQKERKPRDSGGGVSGGTSGNTAEPLGLEGILYLSFGGVLLLMLLIWNVLAFMGDTKALGIGISSVIYYVILMDVIGLVGIVSVPFLLFQYRKTVDVFKVGLGLSVMAMSMGVILLLTAFFRYDFTIKAPTSKPSSDIPVAAPVELPAEES